MDVRNATKGEATRDTKRQGRRTGGKGGLDRHEMGGLLGVLAGLCVLTRLQSPRIHPIERGVAGGNAGCGAHFHQFILLALLLQLAHALFDLPFLGLGLLFLQPYLFEVAIGARMPSGRVENRNVTLIGTLAAFARFQWR